MPALTDTHAASALLKGHRALVWKVLLQLGLTNWCFCCCVVIACWQRAALFQQLCYLCCVVPAVLACA